MIRATGKDGSEESDLVLAPTTTLAEALAVITRANRAAGIAEAQSDARFLLQGLLGIDAAEFVREPHRILAADANAIVAGVKRRLGGEPVSRILGVRQFYGRTFRITPDVLDPRPDTETLIDAVLATLKREGRAAQPVTIADIGSGSGAIIVTLLAELPEARGIATDVSGAALEITRENARRLGVDRRLTLFETRGLKGINAAIEIVVSNPPYIASDAIAGLDTGVRDFDPRVALDGGPDGLTVYREIYNDISILPSLRWVFVEVGAGQADDVKHILSGNGLEACGSWRDLGGVERVVALRLHG